ncbi:MAG: ABC transporter permease [Myxococcales bacterium]|nr:ABC transporter permease [Myxococcales bacterium]
MSEAVSRPSLPPGVRRGVWSVVVVLLLFDGLAFLAGEAPRVALLKALEGTWGTMYGLGQVIYKATPLLLTGLGFRVALRAGLFNIGVEGQLLLGSFAAGVVASRLPSSTPWPLGVLMSLGAAGVGGAGLGAVAGAMKVKFGAHEVIVTLLLNRIVEALVPYVLRRGVGVTGYRSGDAISGALLPRLEQLSEVFRGSAASLATVLALVVCLLVLRWERSSVTGREFGWVGLGAGVCEAQGLPGGRRLWQAMALSGGRAGLGASATVLGYKGYYELGLGAGAGFGGIAVAMLGQGSAVGLVGAALLLGTLQQAGLVLNASLPREAMDVLTAAVLVAASAGRGRR